MCDDICNKKMPGPDRGSIVLASTGPKCIIPIEGILITVQRRLTGDMSSIMFAKNYVVCNTGNKVVHWVNVNRVRGIRERLVSDTDGNNKVQVLFDADGFRYVADNIDVIQFLTELYLAKETVNEEST